MQQVSLSLPSHDCSMIKIREKLPMIPDFYLSRQVSPLLQPLTRQGMPSFSLSWELDAASGFEFLLPLASSFPVDTLSIPRLLNVIGRFTNEELAATELVRFITIGFDFATILSSSFCSCILFAIVLWQLVKLKRSINDAKCTVCPSFLASAITSVLFLTFVKFHASIFKFFHLFFHCCFRIWNFHCLRHRNKFVHQIVVTKWIHAFSCNVIFMISVRSSLHECPHRFVGFSNTSIFVLCCPTVRQVSQCWWSWSFTRHCCWHRNFQLSTSIFHCTLEFFIIITKKSNSLTFSVASSLVCTSPLAVTTVVGFFDTLTVSNSAELRSLLLTICILAPESTTNSLSSGFKVDAASIIHSLVGE